jgi:FKBP-type peptidyl-prolyl cis-trans isomerase
MHPIRLVFLALVLAAPLAVQAQREKLPPEDLAIVEKQWPDAKKTSTGLRYIIIKEGEGDFAKPGDELSVLYHGSLLSGKTFDERKNPADPFVFRLGRAQVIQGWDQGLQLMKRGAKMLLIVPPEMGYGTRGRLPVIPRNSTLVFEIELIDIKPEILPPSALPPPDNKKK